MHLAAEPSRPSLLDEALDAWTYARDGVIAELENIPENEFGFQPTPHSRTVAELAQHIVESTLVAAGELAKSRRDGDIRAPRNSHQAAQKVGAPTDKLRAG